MNVTDLIASAAFTEDECDAGTSGFCAMFALALYRATIALNPTLVLVGAEREGKPVLCRDGSLWWCHAAVKVQGQYYDIEGEQKPEWMINNYAWGYSGARGKGTLFDMEPRPFVETIRLESSARDWRFYTMCKRRLGVTSER